MADDYGSLVNEVVDESRRSMSTTIERIILDSITYYESQRFFFNEFRNQTFSLSTSQEYYTSADNTMIPRLQEIDALTITVNSAYKPVLSKWGWTEIEDINGAIQSTGQPIAYAYWGQQIRIYPVPNNGYEARLSGVMQAPSLSLSTDSSCWTIRGQGKELIKQRTKSILYSEYLRDDINAGRAFQREMQEFERLIKKTTTLQATGDIAPCL